MKTLLVTMLFVLSAQAFAEAPQAKEGLSQNNCTSELADYLEEMKYKDVLVGHGEENEYRQSYILISSFNSSSAGLIYTSEEITFKIQKDHSCELFVRTSPSQRKDPGIYYPLETFLRLKK